MSHAMLHSGPKPTPLWTHKGRDNRRVRGLGDVTTGAYVAWGMACVCMPVQVSDAARGHGPVSVQPCVDFKFGLAS